MDMIEASHQQEINNYNIQMEAFFETTMLRDTAFGAITTAIENWEKTITINVF